MKKKQFTYEAELALSPLDGRNKHKLLSLIPFFSESSLIKYRLEVEIRYFIQLSQWNIIRKLTQKEKNILFSVIKKFDSHSYSDIRNIETTVNHEIKAIEEYLKCKLKKTSLKDVSEMVHFGLTSEDITNLAYGLIFQSVIKPIYIPIIERIVAQQKLLMNTCADFPLLGKTHGQPAAPTTMGKELLVFIKRLEDELYILNTLQIHGKLTGNTGNLNAHFFLCNHIDWLTFSNDFVSSLGLIPDMVTTQIEPYDSYIRVFDCLKRINNICIHFSVDMWTYIMLGYFNQKIVKTEVGSTALPHKVNPIYFEGAEGGFEIANSLFEMYARKLSRTRLQRDLSDSTVRRSFGIAFGYCLLSYQSICEGLSRIEADKPMMEEELNKHWEILSEIIQNLFRLQGKENAYEKTKDFFRGKKIDKKTFTEYVQSLSIDPDEKEKLLQIEPKDYLGFSKKIVKTYGKKK